MRNVISKRTMAQLAMALGLTSLCGAASAGTLTGGLAYPGNEIPALTVVAVEQGSGKQFSVQTKAGQRGYRMEVPQGRYIVFALPHGTGAGDEPADKALRGAYSKYSACVMSSPDKASKGECNEHDLITVDVSAKDMHKRIDVYDWYLPEDQKSKLLAIRLDGKAARR
jgi:hypothetical protein